MELDPIAVLEVLARNDIQLIWHANTVATSRSFLVEEAIISREKMQEEGLFLSRQKTDEDDKKFGINHFLYFDPLDLAEHFKRANKYGPILFGVSSNVLSSSSVRCLRIYKINPANWREKQSDERRYYQSVEEFENLFSTGDKFQYGASCLMIDWKDGKLPFSSGLEYILMDSMEQGRGGRFESSVEDLFGGVDGGLEAFRAKYPELKIKWRPRPEWYNYYSEPELRKKFSADSSQKN